jgi:primosomal protein N'
VLVDNSQRLGALSYLVPDHIAVRVGDAVHVPFGKREAYGVVLGEGDASKATREVLGVFGRRIHPADVDTAAELARRHLCALEALVPRFAPRTAKGADAIDAGPVGLKGEQEIGFEPQPVAHRLAWCAPGVDRVRFAAEEAHRLSEHGQVLVLCPTKESVSKVLGQFVSGAARLDAAASRGAWSGFVAGTVRIGVATRAGALFSPRELAGIVVLDCEHPGHTEAVQPHTHARDVALERAKRHDVPLTMVSAVCDPAALQAGVKVMYVGGGLPSSCLVDRPSTSNGNRLVPTVVQLEIRKALEVGKVCLVAPSRCRSACSHCRATVSCPEGHHPAECRCELPPCQRCGTTGHVPSGWDAVRLQTVFASYPHADRLVCVAPDRLSSVTGAVLTVLLDADAPTKTATLQPELGQLRLLVEAAHTLSTEGHLLVVTQDASQALLEKWANGDRRGIARVVWNEAKALNLPPFGRLVLVRVARATAPNVATWPGRVHGPRQVVPGEWEILVRCSDQELPRLSSPLDRLRRSGKVRITVS